MFLKTDHVPAGHCKSRFEENRKVKLTNDKMKLRLQKQACNDCRIFLQCRMSITLKNFLLRLKVFAILRTPSTAPQLSKSIIKTLIAGAGVVWFL